MLEELHVSITIEEGLWRVPPLIFRGDERRGPVSKLSKGMTVLQLLLLKITLFSQIQSDMQQSENTKGPNCCSTSIRMAVQVSADKLKLS